MKLSIGTLLALVTLIGSILLGGANFGEVRGAVEEHGKRIATVEQRLETMEEYTRQTHTMTAKMATDMEWIKHTMMGDK